MKPQSTETPMISVFVLQEIAKSEEDAKRLVRTARTNERYVGSKIFPPVRSGPKRWIVQTYYKDTGERPPSGMARLTIPAASTAFDQEN